MGNWKRSVSGFAAATFLLAAVFAQAQPAGASSAPATAAQGPDAVFIQQVGQGGMAAVEFSRLAGGVAASPDVRRTAQKILHDQDRSNRELAIIAARENIQLPKTLDADNARLFDSLAARRGPEFDDAYLQAMRDGHEKMVVLLNSGEATVTTDELRAYIRKTLPAVEAHLQMTRNH